MEAMKKVAAAFDMLAAELPIQGANKKALHAASAAIREEIAEYEARTPTVEGPDFVTDYVVGSDTQSGPVQ